jgi:hypothetical protein
MSSGMQRQSGVGSIVRIPVIKQLDGLPLQTPGSLVWDSSSQSLFISTDTKWVTTSPPSSSISSSTPQIASRATATSVQANSIQAFKFLQMPTIPSITTMPLQEPGGIVLTQDTKQVYYSTPTNWVLLSGGGSSTILTSVGGGISIISSFTSPTYFLKSFIAGAGITITPNFANTTLTFSSTGVVTTITAGPGISITGTATNPIVNNTGVITTTAGPGISITGTASNPIINNTGVISVTPGTGISNTGTATNPILNNTGVISVTAGTGITNTGTAANPILNSTGVVTTITAGPGISITGTATNPIVNNIATLSSEPTGISTYSIVSTGSVNPTPLRNKTITAGMNITIVDSGTDLTLTSTASSSITGFSAMKSGTQLFSYVGPQPTSGVITGWTTAGGNNFDSIGGGAFVPATGVFTVPTTGVYGITVNVTMIPNTNQNSYWLVLRVNGVTTSYRTEDQPSSNIALNTTLRLATNGFFTIGDTLDVFISDTIAVPGSSFTVNGSPDTWFSILKY